jgi:eukaryotic-like serine/threonine-protein kinase
MDPERWKRIDSLLHAALERPPAEREGFLRQACAGDEALEREVRSLLTSDQQAGSFLDSPAAELLESQESTVTRLAGQTISHYKVLEMLGTGGMGVVYKAFDTKLNRMVALKFLPPHLRHNDELKRRLKEEARAASTMDHPNIVVIHDIDEAPGGDLFIAMAFHEGVTLRARIAAEKNGAGLPVPEALHIARQIASGLAKAHERGVLHRDIKPGNVIVAKDGVARIIDFGLAKSSDAAASLDGTTKGTPLYMSPEQASGKALDCRTDLWSLGAVLYEMMAGRPPFTGDGHLQIMHAIVHDSPPKLLDFRPDLAPEIDRIVSRALEKEPAKRYQSASEMVRDLSTALAATDASTQAPISWRAANAIRAKVIAPAAAVVLAVFAAGYFYFPRALHGKPQLTDKDTIILADFTNKTGDPVFDETLRQGLAVQLQQSPFLSLVSDQHIQKALRLMGQPADARLTPELANEVCERTSGSAVLDGSIANLGTQYVLGLRAKNCRTGDVLDEEQVQAARKEDVLNALSQIASKFRTRVGESLATVEKHSTPLAEATTPSLEALKAYSTAFKILHSTGDLSALPFFKRALEIDPKFAIAYAYLGRIYGEIGESELSAENTTKAYQLRDRASDAEKFFITATYDQQVIGNLEKAQETFELWGQTYPRQYEPPGLLSGTVYPFFGKYQEAIEQGKRAIALDPDVPFGYVDLATAYQFVDRLDEAEATCRRMSERKLEIPELLAESYMLAVLKGDKAGMERVVARSRGKPDAEDWVDDYQGFGLAYSGLRQHARSMTRRAADLASQAAQPERAALFEIGATVWDAFFGNIREARQGAKAVLERSKSRDVEYGAAFALALSGDSSQSQTLADDLLKRFPEDSAVNFSYVPELRALLALNHNEPARAIELLRIAAPYELGAPPSWFDASFGALYPVYVRGLAYLAAQQGSEAAAEFQKILDHRAIVVSDPIGALAHLQLGRALAMSGDKTKAKMAYEDFLTLWKDADRDLPILKQAQAEYAKIR